MQLQDVCQAIVDCEHKTAPLEGCGYPSIRTPNIGPGYLILEGVNRVSRATYLAWTRRLLPRPGDLIMAREAPVGNVAMIPDGLEPCLGQRTLLIRPDAKVVIPKYLVFLLISPIIQSQIHGKTNGATVAHLNMSDVRKFELPPLPPVPVQHRIASILSAYDDLIENHRKRISILEEMASRLYRKWFVQFHYPGHESWPLADSPLGHIPKGWLSDFSAIATLSRAGITPAEEKADEFEHFSIPAFDDGALPTLDRRETILSNKFKIIEDAILLSKLNPRIRRIWYARPSGVAPAVASTEFLVLKPTASSSIAYLHGLCSSDSFYGRFLGLTGGTSTSHQRVRPETLLSLPVPLPPRQAIDRFDLVYQPIIELVHSLRQQIFILRRTRDLLLPRLMSGTLSVSDLIAAEAAVP